MDEEKIIKVEYLARVEGEGALHLKMKSGKVQEAKLKIFEPPRFFEAFLRERLFSEAPDITARICGICPVAYQMSSVHAMEKILEISPGPEVRLLRRLLYCGEWIESHVLHIYFLHAPDFFGYDDALEIARENADLVKRALRLKKAGNAIVRLIGGREIHPINVKVGGFYRTFETSELEEIKSELSDVREIAYETLEFCSGLDFPDYKNDYTFAALRHETEYPMNEGKLATNRGLLIDPAEYEDHFQETQVDYSTTLHTTLNDDLFLTGPLARYSLNFDRLPGHIQKAALDAGLCETCQNPFQSILVRAVETIFAVEEAISLIDAYEKPDASFVEAPPRAGEAAAITEAPRGILYHRYRLDEKGLITDAKIVAPTSHNQKIMEYDLLQVAERYGNLSEEELTRKCETAIRNYDPCISCSTHFLKLKFEEV